MAVKKERLQAEKLAKVLNEIKAENPFAIFTRQELVQKLKDRKCTNYQLVPKALIDRGHLQECAGFKVEWGITADISPITLINCILDIKKRVSKKSQKLYVPKTPKVEESEEVKKTLKVLESTQFTSDQINAINFLQKDGFIIMRPVIKYEEVKML